MIQEVCLLTVHEPYESHDHPVPINATIVHAKTLLHPQVLQPDGGRMYRCLTEFPGRSTGCIVPVSTLTAELSRRAKLLGLMWDLDNTPLWRRVPNPKTSALRVSSRSRRRCRSYASPTVTAAPGRRAGEPPRPRKKPEALSRRAADGARGPRAGHRSHGCTRRRAKRSPRNSSRRLSLLRRCEPRRPTGRGQP